MAARVLTASLISYYSHSSLLMTSSTMKNLKIEVRLTLNCLSISIYPQDIEGLLRGGLASKQK